jgi:hypothetical protein
MGRLVACVVSPTTPTFKVASGVSLMNAEERVRARFPSGEARKEAAEFQWGGHDARDSGWWVIVTGSESDCEELGRGRTETEAWSDAAGLLGNQAA